MISSGKNRWVKDIRRLRRSKDDLGGGRERLLIEGPHLLADALEAALEVEAVLATPGFSTSELGQALLQRLGRPPMAIDQALLEELSDADSPRGVIAIVCREHGALEELSLASPARAGMPVVVYADGLRDPGNLGALARVVEGAGASALVVSPGSVRTSHPRALRASAGSLLRLPVFESLSWQELDRHLADQNPTWVCLQTRGGTDLYGAAVGGCRVLVLGSESAGISAELAERTDLALTIPMAGDLESLNATVSAGVVLFEWARQGRA